MTHLSEEDLVLLYYNESGVAGNARAHLTECAVCRAAAESLAQTLDACDAWTPAEADAEFRRGVWARLAPQLERPPVLARRFWLTAAAVAALVIAAFFAGRGSLHPAPPITAALSETARERILSIALADHLDRAQLLLTEVANMNDADAARLASHRARARDLASEGRLLRQVMSAENAPLLDEVGRFVLEVANAPGGADAAEIRSLKQRIDSESLLFKVRIIESNLRMRNSGTSGKMS